MLRNWLLGLFASGLWIGNYLIYFARDIAAWWRRRRNRSAAPAPLRLPQLRQPEQAGPLPPAQRRAFPPPEPPPHPVRDVEEVPDPERR